MYLPMLIFYVHVYRWHTPFSYDVVVKSGHIYTCHLTSFIPLSCCQISPSPVVKYPILIERHVSHAEISLQYQGFQVVTDARTYSLLADDPHEANAWVPPPPSVVHLI